MFPINKSKIQVAGAGYRGPLLNHKIKDGHNSTKIGASNIFGGKQLRIQSSAQ